MQSQNRLFDDLARVAAGAMSALAGVKGEIDRDCATSSNAARRDGFVSRDEFDAVKAMAAKARAEQEDLAARVAALEARLAALRRAGRGRPRRRRAVDPINRPER